jgi:RNA polymerase sigma factor (sigma-70 family)
VSRIEAFDDVLAAAQAGGGWACRILWEALAAPVAGYLRSRGAAEPDDLTSEVFLAVFAGLARFRGDESDLRSYVFTIAHHRLVDDLRRQSRRTPDVPWDADSDQRRTPSAEDAALDALASVRTRELLDALAPAQRDVLLLRIVGDLTVEQVADVLGKQPGAVKALQRRGLEALRRRISEEAVPLQAASTMTGPR